LKKKISNKTRRGVGITRLNEVLVPIAKAIETTGHRTMDAFESTTTKRKFYLREPLSTSYLERCEMVSLFYMKMHIRKSWKDTN
jgi:hypothetical protein